MTETSPQEQLVILFADISGSTALYEKLGNIQALKLLTRCLDIMIAVLPPYHGVLVKTIGDEIMCTFPTPVEAFYAACCMQTAIEQHRPDCEYPIYIRIGLHYGAVIREGNDVYGDAVNVAARVTSITRARQIMTTQAVTDTLPPELRNKVRQVSRAEFRGKEETLDVFQINWEQDDTLITRIGLPQFRKPTEGCHELLLRYHQQVVIVDEQKKSVVLGRGDTCNLIITGDFASRQHACIESSFGKFVITDHSANGTYIRFGDNQIIHLAHQKIMLHGSGSISLGQPFGEWPTEIIEYLIQ